MTAPMRVLLVEDEAMLRQLEKNVLVRAGFEVDEAADGVEAVVRIEDLRIAYDLIVCDLGILGVRGEDVIDRAASIRPNVPIIVCTGEPVRRVPHATLLLAKPFRPTQLAEEARRLVAAARPDATA